MDHVIITCDMMYHMQKHLDIAMEAAMDKNSDRFDEEKLVGGATQFINSNYPVGVELCVHEDVQSESQSLGRQHLSLTIALMYSLRDI